MIHYLQSWPTCIPVHMPPCDLTPLLSSLQIETSFPPYWVSPMIWFHQKNVAKVTLCDSQTQAPVSPFGSSKSRVKKSKLTNLTARDQEDRKVNDYLNIIQDHEVPPVKAPEDWSCVNLEEEMPSKAGQTKLLMYRIISK